MLMKMRGVTGFADVSPCWSTDVWGASMVRHIKWPNCPIPAPLISSRGVEGDWQEGEEGILRMAGFQMATFSGLAEWR